MVLRVSTLFGIAVLLVLLAGCGSNTAPPGDPGGDPPSQTETIDMGALRAKVESVASSHTATFDASPDLPVAFTAIWGSPISLLEETTSAYRRVVYNSGSDIYGVNLDGSELANLGGGQWPACPPDGSAIAFTNGGINLMDPDGGNPRYVGGGAWQLAWSPDGGSIASSGGAHIQVTSVSGLYDEWIVGDGSYIADYPTWSPDSARIAFSSDKADPGEPGMRDIYTMGSGGGGLVRLTSDPAWDDSMPTWSPAGDKIAFVRVYVEDPWESGIYVMDADGTDIQRIVAGPCQYPKWSPDGKLIAFERNGSIWYMNASGTGQTEVPGASGTYPAWLLSPSGGRTLIGGFGADAGYDPPFGSRRPLAVVGLTEDGLVSAATIVVSLINWATVSAERLTDTGSQLAGLKILANGVKAVHEDTGRGLALRTFNIRSEPNPGGALVFFSGKTGRITTVIALGDDAASTAGDAPAATLGGTHLTLRGSFTEAYDYRDPSRNLLGSEVREVLLDAETGEIVLPN